MTPWKRLNRASGRADKPGTDLEATSAGPRMSRRGVLTAMGAVPLAAGLYGQSASAASSTARTFLLVHGAWHGGWCWGRVAPLLRSQGHTVLAPTLTGLGERSHLFSPEVTLDTHLADIEQVLSYEDVTDVVLVGHSYAGIVITGVAARAPSRIDQLVYLDAFLPEDGRSFEDLTGVKVVEQAEGRGVPPVATVQEFGITSPEDVEWASSRLGNQPVRTLTDPLRFSPEAIASIPRSFIHSSDLVTDEAEKAKSLGWRSFEMLSAGHDAMVTQPQRLADLLIDISQA